MTRVALYGHYSSEGQREASIEDQYQNCETYAKHEDGWEITHRYHDKALSGSNDANGRPGYRQMPADAQAKRFDVLLVDDFSRLSRDQMGKEIVLHPTADGVERYLTAEVSGDYFGL